MSVWWVIAGLIEFDGVITTETWACEINDDGHSLTLLEAIAAFERHVHDMIADDAVIVRVEATRPQN